MELWLRTRVSPQLREARRRERIAAEARRCDTAGGTDWATGGSGQREGDTDGRRMVRASTAPVPMCFLRRASCGLSCLRATPRRLVSDWPCISGLCVWSDETGMHH